MRVLIQTLVVMVVLSYLFRGMGAWKNSTEIQQSSHTPRSGLEVKNGKVMPNTARREARMQDNPEGGDLDPADDVRRKIFSSVLFCIDKNTKEGCERGGKFGDS